MIRRLQQETILEAATHRVVAGGRLAPVKVAEVASDALAASEAYRNGYAEGYQAGEEDGLRDAKQRTQQLEDSARGRLQDIEHEHQGLAAFADGLRDAIERHGEAMQELAYEVALVSFARALGQKRGDRELGFVAAHDLQVPAVRGVQHPGRA